MGLSRTEAILADLVAFPSVSAESNLPILGYAEAHLAALGFASTRVPDATGQKAGLFARLGPAGEGGVLLSGHLDVVPAEGQAWSRAPFALGVEDARLYGRGTTDMKGFVAAMLAVAEVAAARRLSRPLMLALSYDEELGCLGMRAMADTLVDALGRPEFCIVGEPTSMRIATGHKGKMALRTRCTGVAGHSAQAPDYLNALHLAADFIGLLRDEQAALAARGARDAAYDIPYSTVHAGRMSGGIALNIVPDSAVIDWEIRHLAADDPAGIRARIERGAAEIAALVAARGGGIAVETVNAYPGLDTPPDAPVVARVAALLDAAELTKVAYGTEAGFFAGLGIPTVVCGPGSMEQGHQPDEFIARSQLAACDRMLARLLDGLCA